MEQLYVTTVELDVTVVFNLICSVKLSDPLCRVNELADVPCSIGEGRIPCVELIRAPLSIIGYLSL